MSVLSGTISEEATQSRLACKRLIQYVHARELGPGAQLPPQEELRGRLKFSHASLSRAMRAMVDYGMVTRRRRMGTVVADRDAMIPDLWTVALPIFSHGQENDLFVTTLLRCIQGELAEAGCRWRVYMRQADPDADESNHLSDFPELTEDLHNHRVDSVLSPALLNAEDVQRLGERGLPACHIVSTENFACGVGIDRSAWIAKAVRLFAGEGCRRLALVSTNSLMSDASRSAVETFGKVCVECGVESAELLGAGRAAVWRGGQKIGHAILARDASRRPDGVIVLADVIAVGLGGALAEAGYRPRLAVQTNRLVPLAFALPAIHFEVDTVEMARRGVEMILQRMRRPGLADERQWVVPRRSDQFTVAPQNVAEIPILQRQITGTPLAGAF